MCLHNFLKIKPAETKVYKVFAVRYNYNTGKEELRSPYYLFNWGTCDKVVRRTYYKVPNIDMNSRIQGGAFHSFLLLKSAEEEAKALAMTHQDTLYKVVECRIPAETIFLYKGMYGNTLAYASESIAPVVEVSQFWHGQKYALSVPLHSMTISI